MSKLEQPVQQTLALTRIEQRLKNLDPECTRAKALMALRNFRMSWIDVGKLLAEVARGGDYKEWGYDDFESYCTRELGLKRPTVHKIMLSYDYMRTHQAKRLKNGGDLPDYLTVAELDKARKAGQIDDKDLDEIEVKVFAGEETDEREIRKHLREASAGAKLPGMENAEEKRKLLATARRLRVGLATIGKDLFGDGICQRIDEALLQLEGMA